MAKISAHGEKVHTRFTHTDGGTILLTKKPDLRPGRLLQKSSRESGYAVIKSYSNGTLLLEAGLDTERYAKARGYTKAAA